MIKSLGNVNHKKDTQIIANINWRHTQTALAAAVVLPKKALLSSRSLSRSEYLDLTETH